VELTLTLVSGVAWTLVYADAIRLGLRDRTYAIPVAALALNFAWEVLYGVRGIAEGLTAQSVVNVVWALADVVVVVTYLRFGRAELARSVPRPVSTPLFAAWTVALFAAAFAVQLLFLDEFGGVAAPRYAAFLQNLLMSGLFIAMFVARGGTRGQSVLIAASKWIGTLAPTILFGVLEGSPFIVGIGALCSVFDLGYLALVWSARSGVPDRAGDVRPRPAAARTTERRRTRPPGPRSPAPPPSPRAPARRGGSGRAGG
jgi:hypothetical protein